jgi:hypothetical protein
MLKDILRSFSTTLFAKSAAAVAVIIFTALGYYNDIGAFLMAWVPHITPDIVRIAFWLVAGVALLYLVISLLIKPRHRDLWAERDQLELSAIACLSVGKSVDQPYDVEPQLSRHRLLKDAVRKGSLKVIDMAGDKPNVHTLISREHLREYANAVKISDLTHLIARWDRINAPSKIEPPAPDVPAAKAKNAKQPAVPAEVFAPAITQYVPTGVTSLLLTDGWILNFNPASAIGRKLISFHANGSIGEGKNKNEFRWQMVGGMLEIIRQNNDLQNRFRYDPLGQKFLCTNDPDAKGYKDQSITRDRASARTI